MDLSTINQNFLKLILIDGSRVSLRSIIRSLFHHCIHCRRTKGKRAGTRTVITIITMEYVLGDIACQCVFVYIICPLFPAILTTSQKEILHRNLLSCYECSGLCIQYYRLTISYLSTNCQTLLAFHCRDI